MTRLELAEIGAALLTAATPSIVVEIARMVATRHARSVGVRLETPVAVRRLHRTTALLFPVVVALAVWLPAPSTWMRAMEGAAFLFLSVVGVAALSAIEEASAPARYVDSATRTAPLVHRRVGRYLAWPWRALPFGIAMVGLSTLAWRLGQPLADRRLLVPIVLGLAALVFLWLYEVWMHQIATGPDVAEGADRELHRRFSVRAVFFAELTLVAVCLGVAHALLDLDWTRHGLHGASLSLGGGLAAVIGCALALSSELSRRRYLPVDDPGRLASGRR